MSELKKRKAGAPIGNSNAVGNCGGAPEVYSQEWIANEAEVFRKWMQKPDSLYFGSFAIERGYCRQRLSEFANKSIEFSEALEYAKSWQECRLVNLGLRNEINSSLTKFVLQNCHEWTEKQQMSGDANSPLAWILQKADGKSKDLVNNDSNKD
jgi:hypothetical protein